MTARRAREPIALHPTGPDAAFDELYRELGTLVRIISDLKLEVARLQSQAAQPRWTRTYWSLKDIAADLGVSRHTIAELIRRGELDAVTIGDKRKAVTAASYARYRAKLEADA